MCFQKSNEPTSIYNISFLSRKRTSRENGAFLLTLPMTTPLSVNVSIVLMRTVYHVMSRISIIHPPANHCVILVLAHVIKRHHVTRFPLQANIFACKKHQTSHWACRLVGHTHRALLKNKEFSNTQRCLKYIIRFLCLYSYTNITDRKISSGKLKGGGRQVLSSKDWTTSCHWNFHKDSASDCTLLKVLLTTINKMKLE